MMLKLIKPCVVAGHPGLQPGDVFEEKGIFADQLVTEGIAEGTKSPMSKVQSPESIETREPAVETREPEVSVPKFPKRVKPGRPA